MTIETTDAASTRNRAAYLAIGVGSFITWHTALRWWALSIERDAGFELWWWDYVLILLKSPIDLESNPNIFVLPVLTIAAALVCIGSTGTQLRRLGWSPTLVLALGIPVLDLILVGALVLGITHRAGPGESDCKSLWRLVTSEERYLVGSVVFITAAVTISLVLFSTAWLNNYGWALFLGSPFLQGFVVGLLYNDQAKRGLRTTIRVAFLAIGFTALLLMALALEGMICIAMAAPIALGLSAFGALLGWLMSGRFRFRAASVMPAVAVLAPGMFIAEEVMLPPPPVFAATTTLEIDAPPQVVWDAMVAFPELSEPEDWLFRLGVAYPTGARIVGTGVGATRYCDFSTGPVVEPIEVWDEPRRLRFRVISTPAPMVEMSPYDEVHAPHLDGFMKARVGEFRLVELADGRTRLEGTSWYSHNLWPTAYWTRWTDRIAHSVHERVFNDIKRRAEVQARWGDEVL